MKIAILGIRGVPARHGGFETFAENFCLYLIEKGWKVTVYCQVVGDGDFYEDEWNGVQRVHIPVKKEGAIGTIIFDLLSTLHACKKRTPVLTLGYNTAIFNILYKIYRIKNIINMDGIEWKRGKWNFLERTWLRLNEYIGAKVGNHLIADHPEIKKHLSRYVEQNKITTIPYGAVKVSDPDINLLDKYKLEKNCYAILIARPEPENSILEIVTAYSSKKRGMPLVVLGQYYPAVSPYHRQVLSAASEEVVFLGALYDHALVQSLRFYARFHFHGHTVGGTNPSLVEALGASSPVLAHDNRFNRWVAGGGAHYFSSVEECSEKIGLLIESNDLIEKMKKSSFIQYKEKFTFSLIHEKYEKMLIKEFNI